MPIRATLEVCEDLRFEQDNKMTVVGVFNTDIAITPGPYPVTKLMFLFHIDGSSDIIPSELYIQVTVGESEPRRQSIAIPQWMGENTRDFWRLRGVILFENEIIDPANVVAKVVLDGEEYEVASPNFVIGQMPAGLPASP